jgi:hypothetical protein
VFGSKSVPPHIKQLKANLPNFAVVSFVKNDTAVAQMVKFFVGLSATFQQPKAVQQWG